MRTLIDSRTRGGYHAFNMVEGNTLRVTCLASGSSGNCLLIQYDGRALLIDAGLSARKLATYLGERGVGPGMLDGILITHEHTDHVAGADLLSRRFEAPLISNPPTLAQLAARFGRVESRALLVGEVISVGEFEVGSFPVSHDAAQPVGYIVEAAGTRVALMTDLGSITPDVLAPVSRADLVVLEANHDVQRLVEGPYPAHLKRRILSERGHLSNGQAAELIAAALSSRPQTFWLAHLSRTNNTKTKAKQGVLGHLAREGLAPEVLVTDRDKPSLVWEPPTTDRQLSLFSTSWA